MAHSGDKAVVTAMAGLWLRLRTPRLAWPAAVMLILALSLGLWVLLIWLFAGL